MNTLSAMVLFLSTQQSSLIGPSLYIPFSIVLALATLSRVGITPYLTFYTWHLFLSSSAYLTMANAMAISPEMKTLFEEGGRRLNVFSVLCHSLGSVSLMNASIIALKIGEAGLAEQQFAFAFGVYLVAVSANGDDAVRFWQLIGCASMFTIGILQLPGIDRSEMQAQVVFSCSVVGSFALIVAAIMNYFRVAAGLVRLPASPGKEHMRAAPTPAQEASPQPGLIGRIKSALTSCQGREDPGATMASDHSSSMTSESSSSRNWSQSSGDSHPRL